MRGFFDFLISFAEVIGIFITCLVFVGGLVFIVVTFIERTST